MIKKTRIELTKCFLKVSTERVVLDIDVVSTVVIKSLSDCVSYTHQSDEYSDHDRKNKVLLGNKL